MTFTIDVKRPSQLYSPRAYGGCVDPKKMSWYVYPVLKVCDLYTFVRLSLNCSVLLKRSLTTQPACPRSESPVSCSVGRPPFPTSCGMPLMPYRPGRSLVSVPYVGIRFVCSRLIPTLASLMTVGLNMCMWLAAKPCTRTVSSPSANQPPSASPSNGGGLILSLSEKLYRSKKRSFEP